MRARRAWSTSAGGRLKGSSACANNPAAKKKNRALRSIFFLDYNTTPGVGKKTKPPRRPPVTPRVTPLSPACHPTRTRHQTLPVPSQGGIIDGDSNGHHF